MSGPTGPGVDHPVADLGGGLGRAFVALALIDASATTALGDTRALDEDHVSADARRALTALVHPWKAAVAPPLSRSMQSDRASVLPPVSSFCVGVPRAMIRA
jgi:hypothetical protein